MPIATCLHERVHRRAGGVVPRIVASVFTNTDFPLAPMPRKNSACALVAPVRQ